MRLYTRSGKNRFPLRVPLAEYRPFNREDPMDCHDIRHRLHAWVDRELPTTQAQRIEHHLAQCPDCRQEAEGIKQIAALLDALPAVPAPAALARNTLMAFRAGLNAPTMGEWWRSLTLTMRGAVCGAALAGLLFGAVLGTTFVAPGSNTAANPYQTLYASRGIFP